MKLTTLSARNFKGLNFDLQLSSINFLIGANFAGKTARTDAIRLLLLGYLPELGKLPRATFGLSSAESMEVSGEFDDGSRIRRRFFLKGDTVKTEEEVPQHLAECGRLAVMLNAEVYFALSDRDRVSYVFENVWMNLDEFSPASILMRLDSVTKETGEERIIDAIDLTARSAEDQSPRGYIAAAITCAAECVKKEKDHGVQMQKTIQGLSSLRAQDEVSRFNLSQLDEDRAKLLEEITQLTNERASKFAQVEAIKKGRQRRLEIQNNASRFRDAAAQLATLKEKLAKATAEKNEIPIVPLRPLLDEHNAARLEWHEAKNAVLAVGRDLSALNDQIADMGKLCTCPYCGTEGDVWKDKAMAELRGKIESASLRRLECEGAVRLANARFVKANEEYEKANDNSERFDIGTKLERSLENDIAGTQRVVDKLEAEKKELEGLEPENPDLVSDVTSATLAINVKNDQVKKIDANRQLAIGRAQDLKRLAQAEKERDDSVAALEIAKAAEKELRAIQAEMVEAAFKPLLVSANGFFGTVLKTELAYHQGEIGTWRDGVWVAHHTFSGTEKALAYAAIQAALTARSPVRIMLIDELARVDDGNLHALIAGVMQGIKAGELDQFVGIDTGRGGSYQAAKSSSQHFHPDLAFQILKV